MQALLQAIASMPLATDAQRIFHGRGGLYPGCEHWVLDVFPPVLVLTSFLPVTAETEQALAIIGQALSDRWQHIAPHDVPLTWVFQSRNEQIRGENRVQTRLMSARVPQPHVVTEHGAKYHVHVLQGQNHGLFLDMAEGRRWVRDYAASRRGESGGLKVLNLFAYTCAFSVVALLGGARHVVNVDMSKGAIATGQQNHQLNGLTDGASFWAHDIFTSWGKITRTGPYDLVVIDPPSYQKGSFVATKDYARLIRRLPDLIAPNGHVLLCLNAPQLSVAFLQEQMQAAAPALKWVGRLDNPAIFADVDTDRALKVVIYQAPA